MKRVRALPFALWGLLGWGCSDARPFTVLAEGDAASVLLSFEGHDGPAAYALDLRSSGPTGEEVDLAEAQEVFALYYACPLQSLRLEVGPLAIGDRDDQRLLTEPDQVFATRMLGEDYGPWEAIAPEPGRFRLRLDRPALSQCGELEALSIEIPGGLSAEPVPRGNLQFAVAIDADRALVVFRNGDHFVVSPDGAIQVSSPSTEVPSLDAVATADGEVVHLLADGRLARGHPERSYQVSGSSLAESLGSFGAMAFDDEARLYALVSRGLLLVRAGEGWSELFRVAAEDARVGLAKIGPNELLGVGLERSRVLRVREGIPLSVVYDTTASNSKANAVIWSERLGPVIAGSVGGIFDNTAGELIVDRGTHFESLPSMKVGRIYSLAPHRNGVLFGGDEGQFAEFDAEAGACPPLDLGRPDGDLTAIVRLGRRVLVIQQGRSPDLRPKAHFVHARGCPLLFD